MTMAAVRVVRAALMVNDPMPGVSALTIRLVTDHDIADPSAHSMPTVSLIEPPGPPSSRGHHLRISTRHGQSSEAARAEDGSGEGLS